MSDGRRRMEMAARGERKCADCRYGAGAVCTNPKARDYIESMNIIIARSVGCMWWGDWWEAK